jgi:HD-GYP domain-containing protein (c-di-GMP phosphodiesterase class II)
MFDINRIIASLDTESLEDFSVTTHSHIDVIEQDIMTLRGGRGGSEQVERILSSIEDVKLQCRLVFLDPLLAYVETVAEVIARIYRNNNQQCDNLTELVLLMFDEIRAACDEVAVRHSLDVQLLEEFRQSMKELLKASSEAEHFDEHVNDMLSSFAYRVHPDMVFKVSEVDSFTRTKHVNPDEQLAVFEDIAITIDNRNPLTIGRTETILNLGLTINQYLPESLGVDGKQLTAAIYLHDMAMVYIPDSVLYKSTKFTSDDIMILEQHPAQGYRFLNLIPQWRHAAEMILQHHERIDGKGYPKHLTGSNICQGAKIIAVADAFYSLTHERFDRQYKKSLLRALLEINKNNGTQFDPACVEAINLAIQERA